MVDRSCPLTSQYLRVLGQRIDGNHLVGDHAKSAYRLLVEQADHAGNSRVRLHQRAFLCVEIMAVRGIASTRNVGVPEVASLRWTKSASGLTELLKATRADRDDLVAMHTERMFADADPTAGLEQLHAVKEQRQLSYLTHLEKAAELLRSSLRKGFIMKALSALGHHLYEVTYLLGTAAQLDIALELLEQTENHERRAWEPRRP